jgi:hypothetical protein
MIICNLDGQRSKQIAKNLARKYQEQERINKYVQSSISDRIKTAFENK